MFGVFTVRFIIITPFLLFKRSNNKIKTECKTVNGDNVIIGFLYAITVCFVWE